MIFKTWLRIILCGVCVTIIHAQKEEPARTPPPAQEAQSPQENQKKTSPEVLNFVPKPFFKLAPFKISIFQNQGIKKIVYIESTIETQESEWEKIRLRIPLLYHYLFLDLYQSLNFLWDKVSRISPKTLEKRFMAVCQRVLGEGKVKRVFIGAVLVTENG